MNFEYKKWNTILGWICFLIAFVTYLLTIEHDFSFWDCGEYISSASKLEVTHSPGAAVFQIIGAVFSIFALGNTANYGLVINAMSALFSALTILFLFWSITHLMLKSLQKNIHEELDFNTKISTLTSGIIGSLAFTFTDTFWYSAVEGEVYSMASLFTAMLFWMICKWENVQDKKTEQRWILLISLIIGLSVGVHMMVLLVIPAICYVYYTKKYIFTIKSFIITNIITLLIFGIIFKGIFPFVMNLFGKIEIFFVNEIGLPFNSGSIFTLVILVGIFYFSLRYTIKHKFPNFTTIILSILFMLIGFSSWMVIPIRASANPPMNLNNPDNAIGMLDYYNREQYGDWPVAYGANYTVHLASDGILRDDQGNPQTINKGKIYEKNDKKGKYIPTGDRIDYIYNPKYESILPRMYNPDPQIMENYGLMEGYPDFTLNSDYLNEPQAQKIIEELKHKKEIGEIKIQDYQKYGALMDLKKPTFAQSMDFFFNYQIGYMFVRYFLWNFAGRQNDFEGQYEINKGNWVSGIPVIDKTVLGDQKTLPNRFTNKSTNYYYFLPLILGLIGFFFQLNTDTRRFFALISLFLLTSIGIILYTSVRPFEPRERDYALVSSFYTFAIWIGIGAGFLMTLVQKLNTKIAYIGVFALTSIVPIILASQNWDDHNRSQRTAAYDQAYSYINHLDKNSILFTYGDNDTYPLWAIQETSGFRTDVKIVNYTLLGTAWNIDQVKRKTYLADAIPGQLEHDNYRDGINDMIRVMNTSDFDDIFESLQQNQMETSDYESLKIDSQKDSMTAKQAINYILKKNPTKQKFLNTIYNTTGNDINLLPVKKIIIPVNKENAIKYGIVQKEDADKMVDYITINLKTSSLRKELLAMLDMFANYNWDRSIYFSSGGTYSDANLFFMNDYLQFEGFVYKLVPIKTIENDQTEMGRINPNVLYKIIKGFKWSNFKNPNVHYDETALSSIIIYRNAVSRGAEELIKVGQKSKAKELLNLVNQEIPVKMYPTNNSITSIIHAYIILGDEKQALNLAKEYQNNIFSELDYYENLPVKDKMRVQTEVGRLRFQYALLVENIFNAYEETKQIEKATNYIQNAVKPIDDRFYKKIKNKQNNPETLIKDYYSSFFQVIYQRDSLFVKNKLNSLMN